MPKYYTKRPDGSFHIQKKICGKCLYFGIYRTEEEVKNRVEFLKKKNWNVKYMVKQSPKYYHKVYNDKYQVCKKINNRMYYFGIYDTEEEAKNMVAFLKQHNWDLHYAHIHNPETKYINKHHEIYQICRFNKDTGKTEYYGSFHTLEEAKAERDLLEKCNWDWELICNGGGL